MHKESAIRFHYGWTVLIMGTFAVFGALGLARFGYSTVLPAIQLDLALTNEHMGLLATFNLAGYLVMSIIGGALASRYGIRVVVTLGLILAGLGMIFTGLAKGFPELALWRGLTGIGSGAANVATMGLWAAWFDIKKRGLASGIAVSGSSVALIVTGIMAPLIISGHGESSWRICWYVFGGLTLFMALGTLILIRNHPTEIGLSPVGHSGVLPEKTNPTKKRNWALVYRSSIVWKIGFIYIAFGFSYIIYMTFFIKYLIAEGGYTTSTAGGLFMIMGWCSLLCGLIWGSVSDRIGRRKTLIILFLIHSLAFGCFAIGGNQLLFLFSVIIYGLTAWSIPAIMAAVCGDLLGFELAPAALGFITLLFGIGQALGPVIAGKIADTFGTFAPSFWLAAIIALAGAVSTILLKEGFS